MKFKLIFIIIFLLSFSFVFGWSGETHQAICLNNYNYQGDCAKADKEYTPALPYHHCENNLTDCRARVKAEEYKDVDMDIYFHLIADANCPAHWYSLESYDHSKFEKCVNDYIISKQEYWICSFDVIDKSGITRHLYADQNLIVKKEVVIVPPTNETFSPIVVEKKVGFFDSIKDSWDNFMERLNYYFTLKWIFKEKPIINNTYINETNTTL